MSNKGFEKVVMTIHIMKFLGMTKSGVYEFLCDICGYHTLDSALGIKVLNRGDREARHFGAATSYPDIDTSDAEFGLGIDASEDLGPFEDFLGGA
jgi:hypothetical protein